MGYIGKRHSKHVSSIANGVVHSVAYEKDTSTELAATLILTCESQPCVYEANISCLI